MEAEAASFNLNSSRHSLALSSPSLGFLFNSIWPSFVSLVKCPPGQQDVQRANRLDREVGDGDGGKQERGKGERHKWKRKPIKAAQGEVEGDMHKMALQAVPIPRMA